MGTTKEIQADSGSQELKENKEDVVDSIAEETGLDSVEGRQMIEKSVEHVYLDDKYEDLDFTETDQISPTIKESLLSGPRPSHGVAQIIDIREEDGILEIRFQVRGTEKEFTRSYEIGDVPKDSSLSRLFGSRRKATDSRENFEKLVRLTDGRINKPTTLIGESVPIIPESYDSGYSIHHPPKEPSILRKIKYNVVRTLFNHRLISYNDEKDDFDFSYSPNARSWGLVLSCFLVSMLIPISSVASAVFISSFIALMCLIITQVLYIIE